MDENHPVCVKIKIISYVNFFEIFCIYYIGHKSVLVLCICRTALVGALFFGSTFSIRLIFSMATVRKFNKFTLNLIPIAKYISIKLKSWPWSITIPVWMDKHECHTVDTFVLYLPKNWPKTKSAYSHHNEIDQNNASSLYMVSKVQRNLPIWIQRMFCYEWGPFLMVNGILLFLMFNE